MPSVLETLPKQSVESLPTAPTGYVINQGSAYDSSGLFGYSNFELSSVFRTTGDTTASILRYLKNQPLLESDIPLLEGYTQKRLNEYRPWLAHHAEHPKGSRYGGDFNINNALDRAFTFRDSSFQPGNLARTAAVVATFGLAQPFVLGGSYVAGGGASVGLSPSPLITTQQYALADTKLNIKGVQVTSGLSTHETSLVQSAGTGYYSFGQVQAGDPKQPETFLNRIARMVGGSASAYGATAGIGSTLAVTESSPGYLKLLANTVKTTGTGFSTGQIGQAIIGLFGNKVGGVIVSLLGGDFKRAIEIATTNPPNTGPLLFGPSGSSGGGGGGGGGGGYSPTQNTGQMNLTSVMMPVLILSALGFVLWYFLRKKA